ncbi:hypothetical protein AB0B51_24510, partial [Streptomyces griseus]
PGGTEPRPESHATPHPRRPPPSHPYPDQQPPPRHPAVLDGVRRVVECSRAAGTPVRVFSLASDLDHYLEHLPTPDGYMMCTAELRQLLLRHSTRT